MRKYLKQIDSSLEFKKNLLPISQLIAKYIQNISVCLSFNEFVTK